MEYSRKIFLGYDIPLIEHQVDDNGKSVNRYNKYSDLLPVMVTNPEWGKVMNQEFSIWHKSVEEIQSDYNITFPITRKQFDEELEDDLKMKMGWFIYGHDTSNYVYINRHYYDLMDQKKKFFIPTPIYNYLLRTVDINKLSLPDDLLNYIKQGNAKILFYQDCEGFIHTFEDINWFESFIDKFGLGNENVILQTANYKLPDVIKKWEFQFNKKCRLITQIYNQFEEVMWFANPSVKTNTWERENHYNQFHKFLNFRRNHTSNKHFMCFARRFTPERAAIFHKIHTTPSLSERGMYSLHNPYEFDHEKAMGEVHSMNLSGEYYNTLNQWFGEHFDYTNGFSWDRSDQHTNWATSLPEDVHRDSFVNIVIETHQRSLDDGELFLSEKTFRPMYAAQPFIIFGNPGTLKLLKDLGYQTFSDYWDESYDEPGSIEVRLNRLYRTMLSITQKPLDDWKKISVDIDNRLIHNFNVLMDTKRLDNRLKSLYDYCVS